MTYLVCQGKALTALAGGSVDDHDLTVGTRHKAGVRSKKMLVLNSRNAKVSSELFDIDRRFVFACGFKKFPSAFECHMLRYQMWCLAHEAELLLSHSWFPHFGQTLAAVLCQYPQWVHQNSSQKNDAWRLSMNLTP